MTLFIFDATNIAPKRILPGPGIGFTEGGDYLSISVTGSFFTGTSGGSGGGTSIYGLMAGRIPIVSTGSTLVDTPLLSFTGTVLTILSGSAIIGSTLEVFGDTALHANLTLDGGDISMTAGTLSLDGTVLTMNVGSFGTTSTDIDFFSGTLGLTNVDTDLVSGNFNTFNTDFGFLGGSITIDNLDITIGSLTEDAIGSNPGTLGFAFTSTLTKSYGPLVFPNLATGTVAFFAGNSLLTGSAGFTFDLPNSTITLSGDIKLDTLGKAIYMRRLTSNAEIAVLSILTGTDTLTMKMPTSVDSAIGFQIVDTSNVLKASMTRYGQLALPMTGTIGGLLIGGDTNLFRDSANVIASDDLIATKGGASGFRFADRTNITGTWTLYADGNRARLYKDFNTPGDVFSFGSDGIISGSKYFNGSYTPTWTAATSGTSLGNGTIVGRYQRFGNLCHTFVQLNIGSSTNKGAGVWEFSLPITPFTGTARFPVGAGFALDNGVGDFEGACRLDITTAKVRVFLQTGSRSSAAASNYPMIWGTSDILAFDITYEVA